jgi:hypothetical protein
VQHRAALLIDLDDNDLVRRAIEAPLAVAWHECKPLANDIIDDLYSDSFEVRPTMSTLVRVQVGIGVKRDDVPDPFLAEVVPSVL